METKTLQEQIDKFYDETGYRLEVKDGKPYYDGNLDLRVINISEWPDNLVVGGWLNLCDTKVTKLPDNLVVGGWFNLRYAEIAELPNNLVVGGSLDLYDTDIAKLPDNLVVGGCLDISHTKITELPDNLVVGDSLYLANTKITELPDNLVAGVIFGMSYTPIRPTLTKKAEEKVKKVYSSIQNIKNFLQWNVGCKTYIRTDGIFSVVDSHRGNVWRTHRIGKDETLYVVSDGEGHYAHGKTLAEAKADLIYKINDRDTSLYENLSLDDEISFEEAIAMYRTITGACAAGTRGFIESRLPKPHKDKYTIKEIIYLTDGEYGSKMLKDFFNVDKR